MAKDQVLPKPCGPRLPAANTPCLGQIEENLGGHPCWVAFRIAPQMVAVEQGGGNKRTSMKLKSRRSWFSNS